MLILIAAAAAQAAGIATNSKASDAVVVSLELPNANAITTAPPIVAAPRIASYQQLTPVGAAIAVRVTAGNRVLFNDTLRVSSGSGASYSESRSEAALSICPAMRPYGSSERSSLSVQLHLRDNQATGPAVNVTVNWQRPAPGAACDNDGTRSVQLGQTVPLPHGESTTIAGDAGLLVTLTRR